MKEKGLTFTETLTIKQQLWATAAEGAGDSLFAVIDCARSRRAYPILEGTRLERRCLYDGEVPPALLEAAPHLCRLERDRAFDMDLIANGWGESWGFYFTSSASFDDARRHLRRFLKAKDESGNILIFRYYDPRILRVYLPTCTPDELRTFFGPIDQILLESKDGLELVSLSVAAGRLVERRKRLAIGDAATEKSWA